uniref:Protein kinase domain-containing protein n=1 Tax=Salix viminalis TaxID=40686 RepID=A0A6N2LNU8_SALVM
MFESRVELDDLAGTLGFIDPDFMIRNLVTAKTDVISFGLPLLVLITGRNASQLEMSLTESVKDLVEKDQGNEEVNPTIWGNGGVAIDQQQLEAFVKLALRCTNDQEKIAH